VRILHLGARHSLQIVDGVNTVIWLVAAEQARAGHTVTLLLEAEPDGLAQRVASETGMTLKQASYTTWGYESSVVDELIATHDVVHMHSVFIPRQATLGRRLVRAGVPYVITPNGGLSPRVLSRGRLKKWIYSLVAERPRFRASAAVSVVAPGEVAEVRAFVPGYRGLVRSIPNPVDTSTLGSWQWHYRPDARRVVFLGRFDVLHKGLDLLWEIARLLPTIDFDLYGSMHRRSERWFARLRNQRLPNVHIHSPVFGAEKARILVEAALYLQTSRWEGFPLSIAEAMLVGVPVAVVDRLDFSHQFIDHDLGLTFPADPDVAAQLIHHALSDEGRLRQWSERAQTFAREFFSAPVVAQKFVELYQEVVGPQEGPFDPEAPVRILHVGARNSPQIVDGVNTVIWLVAAEQARAGHTVTLLLEAEPNELAQRVASETGMTLKHAPYTTWS